jgi:hypothetical protein
MTTLVFIGELARFPFWPAAIEGSPLTKTLAALVLGIAALTFYRRYALRQRRPRRLSKEEKAALIGALDGNCLASVPVACRFEDSEARTYADDFVVALRGGGCDAILNFEPRLDPDASGVFIVIRKDGSIMEAESLAQAMRTAKVDFRVAFDSQRLAPSIAQGRPRAAQGDRAFESVV